MTSKHISNRSIPRSGSTPRLICYSQSIRERSFDYRTDTKQPIEISGRGKAKVKGPDSKEMTTFRPLIKYNTGSNSIRTLLPESSPIEPIKQSKRFLSSNRESNKNKGNDCDSNPTADQPRHTLRRRSNNPEVYQSSNLFNTTNDSYLNINRTMDYYTRNGNSNSNKKGSNNPYYQKYTNTTQIISLPGGEKRELKDINDDTKPIIKSDKGSYCTKVYKDYKSNIACFPGSGVNTNYHLYNRNKGLTYKYQATDIFNVNPSIQSNSYLNLNQYNYNAYVYRGQFGKRHLMLSNTESSNDVKGRSSGMKCQGYKNLSQVQLC